MRKRKGKPSADPRLLFVVWQDAEGDMEWRRVDEVMPGAPLVFSLGWLIHSSRKAIIIGADFSPSKNGMESNRRLEIPKGMIRQVIDVTLTSNGKPMEMEWPERIPKT